MKKFLSFIFISILVLSLVGCSLGQKETANINLYFANEDNSDIIIEKRQVQLPKGEMIEKIALMELLKGPKEKELRSNIPKNTKLLNIKVENGLVQVDFSEEFAHFPGTMAESLALVSIVNTLTDLKDIKKVSITVDGKELIAPSGNPYGPLTRYDMDNIDELGMRDIIVYFSDSNAEYLVPEHRIVSNTEEESIISELIKGPENPENHPTIPNGARLLSIKVEDNTCIVNFSKEFKENHGGGTTGEIMTIYSVVNSLTELEDIKKVEFLIEGKKEKTLAGHLIFDEPFKRDKQLIRK